MVKKKIFENKGTYRVTLPIAFLRRLGIDKDGLVDVELKGNKIIITKDEKKKVEKVG
jgi:hypothetical protein